MSNYTQPNKNKYKAFTLAEVLITLLIIGVVASIIIPNLLNDTQDAEFKSAFKKTYADIAQAAMQYKMDNGGIIPVDKTTYWNTNVFPTLVSYMKVQKDCGAKSCFTTDSDPIFSYKSLTGEDLFAHHFDDGQRLLINGVFLSSEYTRNLIWVDVNGFIKGPNMLGKDVFGIVVTSTGITPAGSPSSEIEDINCSTSYPGAVWRGWGCAALVMQEIDY